MLNYEKAEVLEDWNDTKGRTKEEVIDQMMATAKRLRNDG